MIKLKNIEKQCTIAQIAERKTAFHKARRFVRQASEQGCVRPEAQPHSFKDGNSKVPNARVDIEIAKGLTFVPDEPRETQFGYG